MKKYLDFDALLRDQNPKKEALQYFDGEKIVSLTYEELLHQIASYPVPKEQINGILCDGSLENVLAIFALAKANKRIVLLNPGESPELLAKQIQGTHVAKLHGLPALQEALAASISEESASEESAILFFTSGTTEAAKAVVLSQESLCASAFNGASLLPLEEEDSLLCCLPLSHVFGFVCSLLWPLQCGASVRLSRGGRKVFEDPMLFHPTAISLVPQMAVYYNRMKLWNPELKLILIGAGPCSKATIQSIQDKGIRVSYGYGLTETSSGVALSLGKDPDWMTVCPEDQLEIAEDGEILVRCPSTIIRDYTADPEKTESVLKEGWLYTGDLGELEEGLLRLKGRKKDILVLFDGTKVFCPEYEKELQQLFPGIDLAIYLDPEGRVRMAVGNGFPSDEDEGKIARFNQGRPRSQRIVGITYHKEALPRTQTGKIKRYDLKA